MKGEPIALVLATISALGALGAAVGAWLSSRATRAAAEAQIFFQFMKEYDSLDMLTSLRVLVNWKIKHGEEFLERYREGLKENNPEAKKLDEARRRVSFYFFKALRLYEAGFISRRSLREIVNVDGIEILYDIVEPLERTLNPNYDKNRFERLRKVSGYPS